MCSSRPSQEPDWADWSGTALLAENGQDYPELEDEKWVVKLMFLTDITGHLNELNLKLQGAGQTVLDMFDTWKAFVGKLAVFSDDVATSTFRYFSHLRELSTQHSISTAEICKYISELESEFTTRFGGISAVWTHVLFLDQTRQL
ncbi:hypothetical protein NHX12_014077 [Muraenolepis orangiensis]|uniref:Uncharacterized protein n=1 Tax=Muraenolepis orangiensis TaxID=630683 RepID=A0A9Q0I6I0_9TELE|nr:hypothetical protein NHX12_014077 [Muraenolepis orangiensis]